MKETKKQIKAQVINEVRNQYNKKLKEKDEAIDLWRKKYLTSEAEWREMSKSCRQLRDDKTEIHPRQKVWPWILVSVLLIILAFAALFFAI